MRQVAALIGLGLVLCAGLLLLTRGDRDLRALSPGKDGMSSARALKETVKEVVPGRLRAPLPRAECPVGLANCVRASGRVLYVETVDPDGDGDLHVVLADRSLTIIKVPAGVRPAHNPGVGDGVGAAGQMTTGSSNEPELRAAVFVMS
jgi:hypothetical protein